MRMPDVVLCFIGIFQELEFFILRRGVQQPDAVVEIEDDPVALVKLFFEPGRADQQGFALNKNEVEVFCPPQVFPPDEKRFENDARFFDIVSRMVKYPVVFFGNNFGKLPVKSLLFKKGEVLLEAVTLAGRAVQAVIGYDEDLFQAYSTTSFFVRTCVAACKVIK